jgi:hypothetical protein
MAAVRAESLLLALTSGGSRGIECHGGPRDTDHSQIKSQSYY